MKHTTISLLIGIAFAAATPVMAADKAKPTPVPATHTTIASISGDSITTTTGAITKTFTIDPKTEIFYLGKRVSASDLQTGMRVTVTQSFDGKMATAITAAEVVKKPAAPAKK